MALALGKSPAEPLWDESLAWISEREGDYAKIVFTCERHIAQGAKTYFRGDPAPLEEDGSLVRIVPLTCIGMVHPDFVAKALEAGASEVQFIGCPPEDCSNREGNLWLQERLDRKRLPKLRICYAEAPIYTDWLPPNDFRYALEKPNTHQEVTGYNTNLGNIKWRNCIPTVILIFQGWLSDIRYQPYRKDTALLEIALNHRAGYPIKETKGNLEPELSIIYPTRLTLEEDGQTLLDQTYLPQGSSHTSLVFEQFPLAKGKHQILLMMFDRPDQNESVVIYDQIHSLVENEILHLSYSDEKVSGDPVAGETLFNEHSIGAGASCSLCHSLEEDVVLVGLSLAGIAERAATRVPDMNPGDYLYQSIVEPDAYVVEGFPAGQMLPDLQERLSQEQIDNLVVFLLTLK